MRTYVQQPLDRAVTRYAEAELGWRRRGTLAVVWLLLGIVVCTIIALRLPPGTDACPSESSLDVRAGNAVVPALGALVLAIEVVLGRKRTPRPAKRTWNARKRLSLAAGGQFLVLAGVFYYEALGVSKYNVGDNQLQPITYYVRCAIANDFFVDLGALSFPAITLVLVLGYCWLLGHWLLDPAIRGATSPGRGSPGGERSSL